MGIVASHARPGWDWALGEVRDVGRKVGPRTEKGRGQPGLHPQVLRVGSRDPGPDCFRRGFARELGQAFSLTAARVALSASRSAPARSPRPGLLCARGSLRRHPPPADSYCLCTLLHSTSVPAALS